MAEKSNTNEFIEKAKKVHFDKYDYSFCDYINAHTKVQIKCLKCGNIFLQQPNSHLNGRGCPICKQENISKKLSSSTTEFIEKAKKVHNNFYDYSLVDYKNANTKIKIICKKHGEFEQKPSSHLNGNGCPICSGRAKSNTNEFIEKAKKIHSEKYDYSFCDYKNAHTKVKIICKKHGEFFQKPNDHLKGVGCPICGGSKKSNTNEFIEKAKKIHFDKYDYSLVSYINAHTKVQIKCLKCGNVFLQAPHEHLKGNGCPTCSGRMKKTTSEFINEAILIHGSKYDYKNVNYKNNRSKVKIICPIHGEFLQIASYHLNGNGCPRCNMSSMEHKVSSWLKTREFQFVQEYVFPDCKDKLPLPFDFYIPSKNLLIECNGEQHYKAIDFFGGRKQFLLQKHHDWLKRNFARKNNIDLLVIKFDENIEEELKAKLYD